MNKKLHFLLIGFALINAGNLFSQTTEDFETETVGASTFSNNGEPFTITNGAGETNYGIYEFSNGGWNGTGADNKFIDNSGGNPPANDGSSFSISTTNGTDITVKSLYLFVAKRNLTTGVSTVITITGKKDGATIYTIVKSSGIIDGANFAPNNGFTFIDFSTEGGVDNSTQNIDEIILSTTGNADYLALDALTIGAEVLSIDNFEMDSKQITVMPNPSSNYFQISGLKESIEYTIYDLLSKKVNSGYIRPNQKIDISKLINGVYFIKVGNVKTIKFLKK